MNTVNALNKKSLHDITELLYGNSLSGIIVNFIAASGIAFTFNDPSLYEIKRIWWLFFVLTLLFRLIDTTAWKRHSGSASYNHQNAILRFIFGMLSTAVLWSTYSVYIVYKVDLFEFTFLLIIISAMAGGAATILAAHKTAAIAYTFIMLVPLSTTLLYSDQDFMNIIGILGFAFFFVLSFSAKKIADFTSQAILWKNQNAVLVNSMEEEVSIRTKQIYELSNIDALTGLYNRSAFLVNLEQRIQEDSKVNKNFALLFIDLDGFKKINDSLGHEVGDSVLKMTARRLSTLSPQEELLCRWGGDEFLVVIDHINNDKSKAFAEKIIKVVSAPYIIDNIHLKLSATIGIAIFPEHAKKETLLIQWADMAMYSKKKYAPSSTGFFDDTLREKVQQERRLKESLAAAIDNEQLYLEFQPIVHSASHELVAFEALIRWKLDGKTIPPFEFIPIAEQYGQIQAIGHWVLRQACLTASQWPENISVSVNVSVLQLKEADFIESVESALIHFKLAPQRLHIEITESVFAEDKDSIIDRVKSLQQRGVAVYIDDFGTEYSSLSIIQDLSANVVKIDKAFVDKLETNGFAIVKAILNIARALNYDVVAEGVESKSQADILEKLGVDYLQGYYFSKPLGTKKVEEFIINQKKYSSTSPTIAVH